MVKKVNDYQTIGTSQKKLTITQKLLKLKNQITDHDHGTTQEFDKLTSETFASRSAQGNLASKNDIVNFVKKNDFDDKLKKVNKKVISNKTKHIEAEKKITDLTNKVAQISEKGYDFFAR